MWVILVILDRKKMLMVTSLKPFANGVKWIDECEKFLWMIFNAKVFTCDPRVFIFLKVFIERETSRLKTSLNSLINYSAL